jgi:hypothetical protein
VAKDGKPVSRNIRAALEELDCRADILNRLNVEDRVHLCRKVHILRSPVKNIRGDSDKAGRRQPIGSVFREINKALAAMHDDHARRWLRPFGQSQVNIHSTPGYFSL